MNEKNSFASSFPKSQIVKEEHLIYKKSTIAKTFEMEIEWLNIMTNFKTWKAL